MKKKNNRTELVYNPYRNREPKRQSPTTAEITAREAVPDHGPPHNTTCGKVLQKEEEKEEGRAGDPNVTKRFLLPIYKKRGTVLNSTMKTESEKPTGILQPGSSAPLEIRSRVDGRTT